MSQPASIEIKRYQCRHIFTDGHRCGSPCLKREQFCYYHHTTRRPAGNTRARGPEQAEFDISIPEDRSAIQSTIGEVLRRIARNEIDPKRAGLLLYGLQIASLNLARAAEPARDAAPVEEITADPELGTLAPQAEINQPSKQKGFAETLIEEFRRSQQLAVEQASRPTRTYSGDPNIKPAIIPTIQAVAKKTCFFVGRKNTGRLLVPPFALRRMGHPGRSYSTTPCRSTVVPLFDHGGAEE
jgi:hypothetical protein